MAEIETSELEPQLARLLALVSAGESVVIVRSGHPVAKIIAVADDVPKAKGPRKPGGWEHLKLPDDFFDPMSEEELALWE